MTTTIEDPGAEDPGFGDPYSQDSGADAEVRQGDIPTSGWSEDPDAGELLERAWGIIANAPWNDDLAEVWTAAAINFRTRYFQWIADHATVPEPSSELDPAEDVPG